MRLQPNPVDQSTRTAVSQALVDKNYGTTGTAAVKAFQQQHKGLKVDGKVGPQTLAAFQKDGFTPAGAPRTAAPVAHPTKPTVTQTKPDPAVTKPAVTKPATQPSATSKPELAPASMTPSQKFDYYSKMVTDHGGTMDPNKPTVLGLRGLSTTGQHHPSGISHNVDDTFVVLNPKTHTATEVSGITHPAQATLSGRPTALLDPGNYSVGPHQKHNGDTSWEVTKRNGANPTGTQTNGVDRTMTGVLFHRGINGGVSSAGCQSFPQASWDKFLGALGGRGTQGYNYTLLNAS